MNVIVRRIIKSKSTSIKKNDYKGCRIVPTKCT